MIMYVGWATALSHPYALVDYYERVSREVTHTKGFFRLYRVPEIAKYKGENFDSDMAESYTCINLDYPVPTNEWDSVDLFPWDASPSF